MLQGEAVPLFEERAANLAVEAWVFRIECTRTAKNKKLKYDPTSNGLAMC